jgi:hypothetical protein
MMGVCTVIRISIREVFSVIELAQHHVQWQDLILPMLHLWILLSNC